VIAARVEGAFSIQRVSQWKLFPHSQLLLSGKKQCVRSLPTSGSRSHCKDISVQVRCLHAAGFSSAAEAGAKNASQF
jgi:hypothetical protein